MLARAARSALRRHSHSPTAVIHRYPHATGPVPAAASSSSSWSRRRMAAMASASQGDGGGQPPAALQHMAVNELQELLSNPVLCEEVQFVDVRERWEHAAAALPHFKLLPLSEASSWAPTIEDELDPQMETVVLCHHGVRSMQMAGFLVGKGFTNVKNVTGGIAAYSMIDRSVPEY